MRTVTQFVSAVIAIVSLTFALPAHAQVLYGSIVGQVADSSNAIVPGANVRLTNNETGQTRVATTNAAGEYTFQTVPGGTYDITITKDGFQTFSAKGVALAAGQVARMDATLRLGAVTTVVSHVLPHPRHVGT